MNQIGAIVLAAGLSSRMGTPKMLLPWKGSTVIQAIVQTLNNCGLTEIIVVTGANSEKLQSLLLPTPVKCVFNPNYANGEMLFSVQVGLGSLIHSNAALFMLGDQPQISEETIKNLLHGYSGQKLVIPSYQMRRGHPWIIHKSIWNEILTIESPGTLRDIVRKYSKEIHYVCVDDPAILEDVDTPEDYLRISKQDGN